MYIHVYIYIYVYIHAWAAVRCWSRPRTPSSRSRPGNLVAASILEKCFPKSTFHEITTHFNWDVMK